MTWKKTIEIIAKHNKYERKRLTTSYFLSDDKIRFLFDECKYKFVFLLDINDQANKLGIVNAIKEKIENKEGMRFTRIDYFSTLVILENNMILNFVQYNIYMNNGIYFTHNSQYYTIVEIIKCKLSLDHCLKNNILNANDFYKCHNFNKNEIINVLKQNHIMNHINLQNIVHGLYIHITKEKIVSMEIFMSLYKYWSNFPKIIREFFLPKIKNDLNEKCTSNSRILFLDDSVELIEIE